MLFDNIFCLTNIRMNFGNYFNILTFDNLLFLTFIALSYKYNILKYGFIFNNNDIISEKLFIRFS